jgi:hypothetical protein
LAFLADGVKLRQVVTTSFDSYRGENGEEVSVCSTEKELDREKKASQDFCFYRESEDGPEQFWVEKTDCYGIEFDPQPAEELFDQLTAALQTEQLWSGNLARPNEWSFSWEFARDGNAD